MQITLTSPTTSEIHFNSSGLCIDIERFDQQSISISKKELLLGFGTGTNFVKLNSLWMFDRSRLRAATLTCLKSRVKRNEVRLPRYRLMFSNLKFRHLRFECIVALASIGPVNLFNRNQMSAQNVDDNIISRRLLYSLFFKRSTSDTKEAFMHF
jgi:hypothetical protein